MPERKTSRAGPLVLFTVAVLALGAVVYRFLDPTGVQDIALTKPADVAELVVLGERIYGTQCAACHGADLKGQPDWRTRKANGRLPAPPHDATGHTWHHDDATLFALTKYGLAALTGKPYETDMPAYDGILNDREIRAVLAYIKSQWPAHIRARQAEISKRARSTPAGS